MQCINYNGCLSDFFPISYGVRQGSILGPILFLIYINVFVQGSDLLSVILFADDTSAVYSSENPQDATETMTHELTKLYEWFCANRLSLNVSKTEALLIKPYFPSNQNVNDRVIIKISGIPADIVGKVTFLGFFFNSHLNWVSHIDHLSKKLWYNQPY